MDQKSHPRRCRCAYSLRWTACVPLTATGHFFTVTDAALKAVPPNGTGVYVFCRRMGPRLIPQYIGRSKRVRQRIREHLERVSLVRALGEGAGKRCVLVAMVQTCRGQSAVRVAHEVETGLIRRFRDLGYALVNERGMRSPTRTVNWLGTGAYAKLIPRKMKL
jgi:hypothetical protein